MVNRARSLTITDSEEVTMSKHDVRPMTSPEYSFPAEEIFKIVMHVDGRLIAVEPPAGGVLMEGDPKLRQALSTLEYGTGQCPGCVPPRICRCVIMGGVVRCFCV
jgi:hypothetical protein